MKIEVLANLFPAAPASDAAEPQGTGEEPGGGFLSVMHEAGAVLEQQEARPQCDATPQVDAQLAGALLASSALGATLGAGSESLSAVAPAEAGTIEPGVSEQPSEEAADAEPAQEDEASPVLSLPVAVPPPPPCDATRPGQECIGRFPQSGPDIAAAKSVSSAEVPAAGDNGALSLLRSGRLTGPAVRQPHEQASVQGNSTGLLPFRGQASPEAPCQEISAGDSADARSQSAAAATAEAASLSAAEPATVSSTGRTPIQPPVRPAQEQAADAPADTRLAQPDPPPGSAVSAGEASSAPGTLTHAAAQVLRAVAPAAADPSGDGETAGKERGQGKAEAQPVAPKADTRGAEAQKPEAEAPRAGMSLAGTGRGQPRDLFETRARQQSPDVPENPVPSTGYAVSGSARGSALRSAPAEAPARQSDFIMQLAQRIQTQSEEGGGALRIQLRPANLGRLEISAEPGAAGVVARIVTESTAVKQYLEGNLHVLEQALQDQGLRVDRLDVTVQSFDARQSAGQQHQAGPGAHAERGSAAAQFNGTAAASGEIVVDTPMITVLGPNSTFHTVA